MRVVGLDIGGAHIKASDGNQYHDHYYFPLWQRKEELPQAISRVLQAANAFDHLVISMTGELCDCFQTKREGVQFIIQAVQQATEIDPLIFLVDGRFVSASQAIGDHALAAASNWRALAGYLARFSKQRHAILIDIGSTTTDLIPIIEGQVVTSGQDDFGRLESSELIYTGTWRSSIAGILGGHATVRFRSSSCPVMNELFATTLDANIVLGYLPEDASCLATADGRPATRANCVARLARMIGLDSTRFGLPDARQLAQLVVDQQIELLFAAALNLVGRCKDDKISLICSGQGEFLAEQVYLRLNQHTPNRFQMVRCSRLLTTAASTCATAHALAVLGQETLLEKYHAETGY